jgi:hypothetical protein
MFSLEFAWYIAPSIHNQELKNACFFQFWPFLGLLSRLVGGAVTTVMDLSD